MRTLIAATLVVTLLSSFTASPAEATPTQVHLRIEGREETLFEGPILTEGHRVRAASDIAAPPGGYRCNGLNNGANPLPGPTPTAAAVDAMGILGEDFDGKWYGEPFEDYFIKRWGPDEQDVDEGEYWGVIVNNVLTDVGGCQYRLDAGDEVLWVYDAFDGRPRLVLYPGDYTGAALPLTATATLNQPFEVEVDSWAAGNEGDPPPAPTRSTTPYVGAEVATVTTGAEGFQKVETASPKTVVTGDGGTVGVTFTEPGWHRIKATDVAAGEEIAIRSNRLDVCVPLPPASDCGPPPPDALVRTPPPVEGEGEGAAGTPPSSAGQGVSAGQGSPAPTGGERLRLRLSRLDRSRIADGIVRVSWRVLDAGVGIRRWRIASQARGRGGAPWVGRASGKEGTSASIRLPRGVSYRLRLTVTDALGRSSSTSLGAVQVPD
jgi:uncharacterized protein DUF4430